METYRNVVITGASSGIGRAVAEDLAGPGVAMLLLALDGPRLEETVALCRKKGAEVASAVLDVRHADVVAKAVLAFDDAHPVDLLLANAGVSAGLSEGDQPEGPGEARRVTEVNYIGMLNTVEPMFPRMMARRRGRIGLVSSMAALRPQPDLPSYSGSKMAVRGYGIAIRGWLKRHGVGVTIIYPGFVTTPMSVRHRGAKPFEVPVDKAARIIVNGLRRGRGAIAFPWPMFIGAFLNMLTPPWFSDLTNAPMRAKVDPDGRK